jgi:hypothetical protein
VAAAAAVDAGVWLDGLTSRRWGVTLQAMLLQEHTGFKAVPTVLSKNELCREAGLEV